jgi:hypothetical protein
MQFAHIVYLRQRVNLQLIVIWVVTLSGVVSLCGVVILCGVVTLRGVVTLCGVVTRVPNFRTNVLSPVSNK